MLDRDIAHGSYPGGVRAAECHGVANEKGGSMNETGGMPKFPGAETTVAKKIGKVGGMKDMKKGAKSVMKKAEGKKVAGK